VKVTEPGSRVLIFYATRHVRLSEPQAAAALVDLVHGEFARRVPEHLGQTLAGSFQDELPMMPRWNEDVLQALGRTGRSGFTSCCPSLLLRRCGDRAHPARLLDVLTERAEAAFFKPMYDWHAQYGIYCGYDQVARSADPIDGQQWYLDYFRTQRWYGAPGNDMDGRTRPHSSIANLYGRPRVWMEGFHSSGWGRRSRRSRTCCTRSTARARPCTTRTRCTTAPRGRGGSGPAQHLLAAAVLAAPADLLLVVVRSPRRRSGYDQERSKRSRFMTLFHTATKSCRNFSWESSHA